MPNGTIIMNVRLHAVPINNAVEDYIYTDWVDAIQRIYQLIKDIVFITSGALLHSIKHTINRLSQMMEI